jgi:hypothetical protein
MTETISSVLHEYADGDVHIERLLGAVHAGARKRRNRRLTAVGGILVAAVLAAVTGAVSTAPEPLSLAAPSAERPPALAHGMTIAKSPDAIGFSPSQFHLDLTGDFVGWKAVSWTSRGGHEELIITTNAEQEILVQADRPHSGTKYHADVPETIDIHGTPAEISQASGQTTISWEPYSWAWLQVTSNAGREAVVQVAQSLIFSSSYRCAVPFQLRGLDDARVVRCQTDLVRDDATGSLVTGGSAWIRFGDAPAEYQISVGTKEEPVKANDSVNGHLTEHRPGDGTVSNPEEYRFSYAGRTVHFWAFPYDGTPRLPLRTVAEAFRPFPSNNPQNWPDTPLP